MEESKLHFFENEFQAKVCLADLLDKLTYKQAEALACALQKWDELDKLLSQKTICKNCKWLETYEGKYICGYMAEVYHTAVEVRNLAAQCPHTAERQKQNT